MDWVTGGRDLETTKSRTTSDWENIFNKIRGMAMDRIKNGYSVLPDIVVVKGEIADVIPLAQRSHDTSPINSARPIINKLQPDFYMVYFEGWCKMFIPPKGIDAKTWGDKMYDDLQYGDIAKMPDKMEVLVVTGKSKDGTFNKTEQFFIIRKDGKVELKQLREEYKSETRKLP